MQFANDAVWIGDEIARQWDSLAEGTQQAQVHADEVHAGVERLRRMGDEWRRTQVVRRSFPFSIGARGGKGLTGWGRHRRSNGRH